MAEISMVVDCLSNSINKFRGRNEHEKKIFLCDPSIRFTGTWRITGVTACLNTSGSARLRLGLGVQGVLRGNRSHNSPHASFAICRKTTDSSS